MSNRCKIVSKGGEWRALLPVYSADQALGTAAIVAAMFVLVVLVEPKAAPVVTTAAAAGGLIVNYTARPAYLLISREQVPLLIETLESIAYQYVPERDHWVPPIPRWSRWTYNFVKVEDFSGSEARVYGPANLLHFVAARL